MANILRLCHQCRAKTVCMGSLTLYYTVIGLIFWLHPYILETDRRLIQIQSRSTPYYKFRAIRIWVTLIFTSRASLMANTTWPYLFHHTLLSYLLAYYMYLYRITCSKKDLKDAVNIERALDLSTYNRRFCKMKTLQKTHSLWLPFGEWEIKGKQKQHGIFSWSLLNCTPTTLDNSTPQQTLSTLSYHN